MQPLEKKKLEYAAWCSVLPIDPLEEIVKNGLVMLGLVWCMLLGYAQASADDQYLKEAYQPATVVSVTKLNTASEFYYDIGMRMNCMLYVGRYKSASNFVPSPIAVNNRVDVRVEEHWMYLFLPPDREVEMRLTTSSQDKSCVNNQSAAAAEVIPAGTILPVTLNSDVESSKSQKGAAITATIMQDVPLVGGTVIRAGSKVTGHVVDVVRPVKGSDESSLSFQFDQVQFDHRTVPITANLRALASVMEVNAARVPKTRESAESSSSWTLVPIGGGQAYGQGGPVVVGSQTVGEYTNQGALAHFASDLDSECRGVVAGNGAPQAFWLFSVKACGTYGFGDARIAHAGRTEPVGQVTLISSGKAVKVGKGSAMLLRVNRSGPEKTQARATLAQAVNQ